MHEFLYERPRTVESIHRTSVASSLDENRELKDDEETPPDTSRWVQIWQKSFFLLAINSSLNQELMFA